MPAQSGNPGRFHPARATSDHKYVLFFLAWRDKCLAALCFKTNSRIDRASKQFFPVQVANALLIAAYARSHGRDLPAMLRQYARRFPFRTCLSAPGRTMAWVQFVISAPVSALPGHGDGPRARHRWFSCPPAPGGGGISGRPASSGAHPVRTVPAFARNAASGRRQA